MAVGGWNTVCGYVVFVLLFHGLGRLGIHYLGIFVLSHLINTTQAYVLYKIVVFKTKGNIVREYCRFCSFYWLSFSLNLALLPFLVEVLNLNPVVSQGILTVLLALFSYLWHVHYTFKPAKAFSV